MMLSFPNPTNTAHAYGVDDDRPYQPALFASLYIAWVTLSEQRWVTSGERRSLSTHTRKALVDRLGEEQGQALWHRFTVHYTPVHGSWLNQAELEIGLFSKQCLGKRRIGNIRKLRAEARAWNRRTNRKRITINWTFDRKKARNKFKYKYNIKQSKL
jgi:hypothetical protein